LKQQEILSNAAILICHLNTPK